MLSSSSGGWSTIRWTLSAGLLPWALLRLATSISSPIHPAAWYHTSNRLPMYVLHDNMVVSIFTPLPSVLHFRSISFIPLIHIIHFPLQAKQATERIAKFERKRPENSDYGSWRGRNYINLRLNAFSFEGKIYISQKNYEHFSLLFFNLFNNFMSIWCFTGLKVDSLSNSKYTTLPEERAWTDQVWA